MIKIASVTDSKNGSQIINEYSKNKLIYKWHYKY